MTRNEAAIEAVKRFKSGKYKATAIKVELEAQLDREYSDWEDDDSCQEEFISRLEPLGLSEDYRVKGPLKYLQFYNDGSVDSEVTFTLSLENPEDILLLPKIVEVWDQFCRDIGEDYSTEGAGMHMALLNNDRCYYPAGMTRTDIRRFTHFKKSMTMLLPALYFLAAHSNWSRMLEYRRPEVAMSDEEHGYTKFNAITYKDGALEFRIFDTCYDRPEAILDNVVVMTNCMRYWTDNYKNPGMDKVCEQVTFGADRSYNLDRFYVTVEHVDLLNRGLKLLKPSYLTIKELKQERNFNTTKRKVAGAEQKAQKEAELSYLEYSERFDWRLKRSRYSLVADYLNHLTPHEAMPDADRHIVEAERQADEVVEQETAKKQSLTTYVEAQLNDWRNNTKGQFTLRA